MNKADLELEQAKMRKRTAKGKNRRNSNKILPHDLSSIPRPESVAELPKPLFILPENRSTQEIPDLDPFFKEPRRAAYYLVSHGPLREPRPIDLQRMRIDRYRHLLTDAGARFEFSIQNFGWYIEQDTYIDLTLDRGASMPFDRLRYPGFRRLLEDIEQKNKYEVVFMDYMVGTWGTEYDWFTRELEPFGVKVLNAYYQGSQWIRARTNRYESLTDGSDVVCFFPALAGNILQAAAPERLLASEDHRLARPASHLREESPYRSGQYPFVQPPHWQDEEKYRNKENLRRRSVETLYMVDPNKEPVLLENWGSRTSIEQFQFAHDRLTVLGFSFSNENRIMTYERSFGDLRVFADPRPEKGIKFHAFRLVEKGKKHVKLHYENVGGYSGFNILDTWKKDLNSKLTGWISSLERGA